MESLIKAHWTQIFLRADLPRRVMSRTTIQSPPHMSSPRHLLIPASSVSNPLHSSTPPSIFSPPRPHWQCHIIQSDVADASDTCASSLQGASEVRTAAQYDAENTRLLDCHSLLRTMSSNVNKTQKAMPQQQLVIPSVPYTSG